MKILITGGAGFIGSHCIKALLKRGDDVWCLDNFNDYYPPKIKEYNISKFLNHPQFNLIRGDILDTNLLNDIFDRIKFDKVLHLAARAGVRFSIKNPKLYTEVNVIGTLNLLETCRFHNIYDFIFASSSSVYGNRDKIPFTETDNVDHPISPYAANKKTVELLAYTYYHLYQFNCIGLRYFTVYGPSGRPDMAPFLFTRLIDEGMPIKRFGDGTTQRDYTYIDDIVDGTISALDYSKGYEIFNLGNNNPVTLNDFIATIEKCLKKKAIIKEYPKQSGDVGKTCADIKKAKRILNYSPNIPFTEGMKRFVEWYKKNKTLYRLELVIPLR